MTEAEKILIAHSILKRLCFGIIPELPTQMNYTPRLCLIVCGEYIIGTLSVISDVIVGYSQKYERLEVNKRITVNFYVSYGVQWCKATADDSWTVDEKLSTSINYTNRYSSDFVYSKIIEIVNSINVHIRKFRWTAPRDITFLFN